MSTNTPKKNRVDETLADQNLIDGLTKHASPITSLVIGGVAMATKDIIGTLQTRINTSNAALTTRATWQAAVGQPRRRCPNPWPLRRRSSSNRAVKVRHAVALSWLPAFGEFMS
jgi:hypothetical protein